MNSLTQLAELGQSPWLDFIRRSFVADGEMQKLIDQGVLGVTSNPAIFEQAIAGSHDYDGAILSLTGEGLSPEEIYDALSIEDVAQAADLFLSVYEKTEGRDGYVSLEVSPLLAHDTEATIADARRLWKALDRQNVMIKIPATLAGVPAIQQAISEGINVNVTLLFSLERYEAVARAYCAGLAARAEKGLSLKVASVASFFVSRMDSLVDPMLESHPDSRAKSILGEVAIANSILAYEIYEEVFGSPEWKGLSDGGAWDQRILWASTSTKNPAYEKTKYVEALIAPATVNTLPLATIHDYLAEGKPEERVSGQKTRAQEVMSLLGELGISRAELGETLEKEAIDKFVDPFHKLIKSIQDKQESFVVGR
ncbi:MAG: transaldolase [Fimbriimonadaceae bacterium]|nr:transaldolase [Fimbriimonadaceae bacterium]